MACSRFDKRFVEGIIGLCSTGAVIQLPNFCRSESGHMRACLNGMSLALLERLLQLVCHQIEFVGCCDDR